MQNERNLSFELLRLISMFSIVYGHNTGYDNCIGFQPIELFGGYKLLCVDYRIFHD